MTNVRDILSFPINNNIVSINGWLVSFAKGFYLIDWNGEDDYLSSDKILINKDGLYDILKNNGKILFNGGGPAVFHKANIEGILSIDPILNEKCLNPTKLLLENNNQWLLVNLNSSYSKKKYDEIGWHDLFK